MLLVCFQDDDEDFIDWGSFEQPGQISEFVDKLFSFNVLVLRNEDPDCRVIRVMTQYEMQNIVERFFTKPDEIIQMTVRNPTKDPFCPYLMLMLETYHKNTVINYKFETLLRNMEIGAIHARCSTALVTGMMNPLYLNSMIDIPEVARLCNMTSFDKLGEIELTCSQSAVAAISKDAGYEYPAETNGLGLDYLLLGPCGRCSGNKVSCTKTIPCDRCLRSKDEKSACMPSLHEMVSRAKVIFKQIQSGGFVHNDHAKYQIYLENSMYCAKSMMKRNEVKDMFKRISKSHDFGAGAIDYNVENLPSPIKHLLHGQEHYKIEWMDNGRYLVKASDTYKTNFLPVEKVIDMARRYGIPPKLLDMCNLNEYDMAYKMWAETVAHPNVVVSYTGISFWVNANIITNTTVKMVTVMVTPMAMISATIVNR
jgi:hypothetical protein